MHRFRPLRRRERLRDDASGGARPHTVLEYEAAGSGEDRRDEGSANWKRVLLDFVKQFVVESLVIVVGAVLLIWFLAWAD